MANPSLWTDAVLSVLESSPCFLYSFLWTRSGSPLLPFSLLRILGSTTTVFFTILQGFVHYPSQTSLREGRGHALRLNHHFVHRHPDRSAASYPAGSTHHLLLLLRHYANTPTPHLLILLSLQLFILSSSIASLETPATHALVYESPYLRRISIHHGCRSLHRTARSGYASVRWHICKP
jgi:hypothetical protein